MRRVAVHGAAGRMGRHVIEQVLAEPSAELAAAIDHAGHAALGQDAGILAGTAEPVGVALQAELSALSGADVVIDFSAPEPTTVLLSEAAEQGVAAVVGTTGMGDAGQAALERAAARVPVVYAPNFSVGVNVLWALAERAVELVGDDFDLEIVEMHHHHKVDAPSGTAVRLSEVVARARGVALSEAAVHGREGQVGARTPGEIGVHALRGGDVVGDHTLILAGPGERLELTHRAHGRHIFARGALRAALWLEGKPPGLYSMADVLSGAGTAPA